MEENMEVMNDEQVNVDEKKSGLGTGLAMLIGGALALGVTAGVKAIKNKIVDRKSSKRKYHGLTAEESDDNFTDISEEVCEEK